MLEHLCKLHNDWIKIAYSFLQNKEDAEDLVQNLYIRLYDYKVPLEKIKYKDDINRYFMYVTIRNMALQFIRKKVFTIDLDQVQVEVETYNDKNIILDEIYKYIDTFDFYDKTLIEIYMHSGLSYRDLAYGTNKVPRMLSANKTLNKKAVEQGTGISVSSMFNSMKQLKEKIKIKFENHESK